MSPGRHCRRRAARPLPEPRLDIHPPRRLGQWLLVILLGLLALAPGVAQAPRRGLQQGVVTVYYDPADEAFAKVALEAASHALPILRSALGLPTRPAANEKPITIEVFRRRDQFNRFAGHDMPTWVQGIALPGRRIGLKTLAPTVMKTVTAHELVHVLFDTVAQEMGVDPPRWLHEGLAKYCADDFTETDRQVLGEASVGRELLPLTQLDAAFAGPPDQVSLAYAQSYTLVRFLHERASAGGLHSLLRNLALTRDVDRALLRTYGEPRPALERLWLDEVHAQYLSRGIPLSMELAIFGVMALLAIGAFLVQGHRRRLIRERLQEEERLRRMFQGPDDDDDEPPPFTDYDRTLE